MKNPESDPFHSDEWDDHIRQRFADFQAEPPADALPRILADLRSSAPSAAGHGRWVFIGLGTLLLLTGSWFVHQHNEPVSAQLMATAATKLQPSRAGAPVNKKRATSSNILAIKPDVLLAKPDSYAQTVTSSEPVARRSAVAAPFQSKPSSAPGAPVALFHLLPGTSEQSLDSPSQRLLALSTLTTQPLKLTIWTATLPTVSAFISSRPESTPQQASVVRKRPVQFVSVMPLYTYQRVHPVETDDIWVKNVTTQSALSTQRAGARVQLGLEWPISRRISLRTSLLYNHLTQQVNYTTRAETPDSVRLELVDDKTVRATPYFRDVRVTRQTDWHYIGVGTDAVWHLGGLGAWRHYTSVGASVGTFVGQSRSGQPLSGFVQVAYGIERPLTPTLWLRVAPTAQYGLNSLSDREGLFHTRPYTYGLTIGLRR